MVNKMNRRTILTGLAAGVVSAGLPLGAFALTTSEAKTLIGKVVGDITRIINSGKAERAMLRDFETVFSRYANTTVIAYRVLGRDARSFSKPQIAAFTKAFQGYISRKYGKRFREFIGGRVEVAKAKQVKSWHEVETRVFLKGSAPFRVDFLVKEAGRKHLFFDMVIEGISLTKVEREEIGVMLDRRQGDIAKLTADLKRAG